jgi:hypothetical protein
LRSYISRLDERPPLLGLGAMKPCVSAVIAFGTSAQANAQMSASHLE